MARLDGVIQFTGSLENLSAYKMRGSDKIIIRKKGGPSRKQVKKSPNFEITRRNNMEFGGRATMAAIIKQNLHPLLFLADYNITGPLNALLKPIQVMDIESESGRRNILLTKEPRLLEGFTLNKRYLFESIVRTPVTCSVQPEQVLIDIPALMPEINFLRPGNYSWYRFIGVAAQVPDMYYDPRGYKPKEDARYLPSFTHGDWLPVNRYEPASQLIIQGMRRKKPAGCSTMISIGVGFGQSQGDTIQPEKYVGAAKVMMVV
jgi:hypothetical protein